MSDVYDEVRGERARAHAKHGDTSMEAQPVDSMLRLAILVEEIGEVAKEFNEARHRGDAAPDLAALRNELVQVAAMAVTWADNIAGRHLPLTAAAVGGSPETPATTEEACWHGWTTAHRIPMPGHTFPRFCPGPVSAGGEDR